MCQAYGAAGAGNTEITGVDVLSAKCRSALCNFVDLSRSRFSTCTFDDDERQCLCMKRKHKSIVGTVGMRLVKDTSDALFVFVIENVQIHEFVDD